MLYRKRDVTVISLDSEGHYLGESKQNLPVPYSRRFNTPILLADNETYTFGTSTYRVNEETALARQELYIKLLEPLDLPQVVKYITSNKKGDGLYTFKIDNELLINREDVQKYWLEVQPLGRVAQCLSCGLKKPCVRYELLEVRAGSNRLQLSTSYNDYHDLTRGDVAPICLDCSIKYTTTLDRFVNDKHHRFWINDKCYVFWSKKVDNVLGLFQQSNIREFLIEAKALENDFNLFSFHENGTRMVIDMWLDAPVVDNLYNFYNTVGWIPITTLNDKSFVDYALYGWKPPLSKLAACLDRPQSLELILKAHGLYDEGSRFYECGTKIDCKYIHQLNYKQLSELSGLNIPNPNLIQRALIVCGNYARK